MKDHLELLSGGSSAINIPAPKRRWATRVGVPLSVALGALILVGFAYRDKLRPKIDVHAVPVAVANPAPSSPSSTPDQGPATGTVSVQAPGWVEPDPHPTFVSALADGIVEELLVLEGDRVEAGQVVARLVREDAELAVARAEAALLRHRAELAADETNWREPVELERAFKVAQAALQETRAQRVADEAELKRQKSLLGEAENVYQSLRPLSDGTVSDVEIETAKFKRDAQEAAWTAAKARLTVLDARIVRLEAEEVAARRNLDLRVDLQRRLQASRAAVAESEARLAEALLRLRRMDIVAPVAGIVMDRLVAPGGKVMLGMDGVTSAHIVHLYDPENLQVRVDVPLKDAANISPGQKVVVVVDVLPDREFSGSVSRFVHRADISKNTVQVKVRIDNPSLHIKPEMLARVKFLVQTSNSSNGNGPGSGGLRVFAPAESLVEDASAVWVVDSARQRVQRRDVVAGRAQRRGWVEIVEGLHPGDLVVVSPPAKLTPGKQVRITQEEDTP